MQDAPQPTGSASPIAIIGGGSIGGAFAIVFARAGRQVRLQEPDPVRRSAIPAVLRTRLSDLDTHGLLDEPPDRIAGRVSLTADLAEGVADACFVAECAPEKLDLKQRL